jgi:hypothetical protein
MRKENCGVSISVTISAEDEFVVAKARWLPMEAVEEKRLSCGVFLERARSQRKHHDHRNRQQRQ